MKDNIKQILKVFIPCFLLGILLGIVSGVFGFENIIKNIMNGDLKEIIINSSPYILMIGGGILSIVSFVIVLYVKKKLNLNDDENILKMEKLLDWGFLISNLLLISNMILFGVVTCNIKSDLIFISIIFFFVYLFIASLCQIIIVNLIKLINPEKKGNLMDKQFQKEWLDSCDEAQKAIIYEVSYKTFQFMNSFLAILLNTLIIINIISNVIGIVPIIIVGLVYLVLIMCYTYYAMKLEYK